MIPSLLYDPEFISALPQLDKYHNPFIVSLCKTDIPWLVDLRNHLDRWYSETKTEDKPIIYASLRSSNDMHFQSVLYELVFRQYGLQRKWQVVRNPIIGGKTPDYNMTIPNGPSFFLEVTVKEPDQERKYSRNRYETLLRRLDTIRTPYQFSVHMQAPISTCLNYDVVKEYVARGFTELIYHDNEDYEIDLAPVGITGDIQIRGKKEEASDDNVIAWGETVDLSDTPKDVANAIRRKVKKYGIIKATGNPYVVAVCAIDEDAIDMALYGKTVISFNVNNPNSEAKVRRDFSGLVTPKPRLFSPLNRRLSAVISCNWKDMPNGSCGFRLKVAPLPAKRDQFQAVTRAG